MPRPRKDIELDTYSNLVAYRLQMLLDQKEMTPDELAEFVPQAPSSIYAWLNGRYNVALDAVPGICQALRCQPQDLFPNELP